MDRFRTVKLRSEADIIFARMRIRQLAADAGLELGSQARISLATSSLAKKLNIGRGHQGEIVIDDLYEAGVPGLKTVCTLDGSSSRDHAAMALESVKWLVDEFSIDTSDPDGKLEVTLIKWKS